MEYYTEIQDTKKLLFVAKKIIRIMAHAKREVYCRELLWEFNILPLCCELSFVVGIMEILQRNSDMHGKQKGKSTTYLCQKLTPWS